MAVLDATGTLLPPTYESWYDPNTSDEEKEKARKRKPASPPSSQEGQDAQFAVLCSEKQAKVLSMPSQSCIYKHNITETSFVLRADVVQMAGSYCITCFCANGHIMTLRLVASTFSISLTVQQRCGLESEQMCRCAACLSHTLRFAVISVCPACGLCWTSTTCR